jgi:Xaa-Pro aminopeptidase
MMLRIAVLWLLALQQSEPPALTHAELSARRERLVAALKDGVLVLDAGPLSRTPGSDSNTSVFDFKYLTNYHEDDGVLILAGKRAWLFVADVKTAAGASGIKDVLARDQFEATARKILPAAPKIYTKLRQANLDAVKAAAPRATVTGQKLAAELTKLRMVKTPLELKLMRRAADATNKAHLAAMHAMKPGLNEGEIQKLVEETFKKEGCPELSFPTIVGSGKNGTVLHYDRNTEAMKDGTLVVCDIGASVHNYVTDITRTLPTGGRFGPEQRAAYQCVLDAQKAAERLLRPGASWRELDQAAARVFQDRKLTKWSYAHSNDGSVRHGLGHHVGMAVHDSDGGAPFEAGMVVTIEPGYYDKDAGWGIRIEDIYLVTKDGFERLSTSPREVDEIEKEMKK